ncbi:10279_t:CDS:2, partial [Acaulospora morrowiae]
QELEQKKPSQQQVASSSTTVGVSKDLFNKGYHSGDNDHQPLNHSNELDSVFSASNGADGGSSKNTALELYIKGVTKEREGNLSEDDHIFKALKSYRQALKLDPSVEHTYRKHFHNAVSEENSEDFVASRSMVQHLEEELRLIENSKSSSVSQKYEEGGGQKNDKELANTGTHKPDISSPENYKDTDQIETLLNSFRNMKLVYEPLNPNRAVHIAKLPNELVIHILKQLIVTGDVNSLEKFGIVCKKFWILSREVSLWKFLCQKAYRDLNLSFGTSNLLQGEYIKLYNNDWRRMYIERPRIRFDGVYISTCHYLRYCIKAWINRKRLESADTLSNILSVYSILLGWYVHYVVNDFRTDIRSQEFFARIQIKGVYEWEMGIRRGYLKNLGSGSRSAEISIFFEFSVEVDLKRKE